MRIARFVLAPDVVEVLAAKDPDAGRIRWGSVEPGSYGIQVSKTKINELEGSPFSDDGLAPVDSGRSWELHQVRLMTPVEPSKIVAIGKNYTAHAAEMDSEVPSAPLMFLKPPSSLIAVGETIVLPVESDQVDFEAELAVVIGTRCKNVAAKDAGSVIAGYTCANDVSARDFQKADGQWTRAKGYDTFCPLGPWIETELDLVSENAQELGVSLELNGEIKQAAVTTQLVFGVAELVEYVSRVMTLLPGDVILTGTPAGVGPMVDGDSVCVRIEGIGALTNEVTLATNGRES